MENYNADYQNFGLNGDANLERNFHVGSLNGGYPNYPLPPQDYYNNSSFFYGGHPSYAQVSSYSLGHANYPHLLYYPQDYTDYDPRSYARHNMPSTPYVCYPDQSSDIRVRQRPVAKTPQPSTVQSSNNPHLSSDFDVLEFCQLCNLFSDDEKRFYRKTEKQIHARGHSEKRSQGFETVYSLCFTSESRGFYQAPTFQRPVNKTWDQQTPPSRSAVNHQYLTQRPVLKRSNQKQAIETIDLDLTIVEPQTTIEKQPYLGQNDIITLVEDEETQIKVLKLDKTSIFKAPVVISNNKLKSQKSSKKLKQIQTGECWTPERNNNDKKTSSIQTPNLGSESEIVTTTVKQDKHRRRLGSKGSPFTKLSMTKEMPTRNSCTVLENVEPTTPNQVLTQTQPWQNGNSELESPIQQSRNHKSVLTGEKESTQPESEKDCPVTIVKCKSKKKTKLKRSTACSVFEKKNVEQTTQQETPNKVVDQSKFTFPVDTREAGSDVLVKTEKRSEAVRVKIVDTVSSTKGRTHQLIQQKKLVKTLETHKKLQNILKISGTAPLKAVKKQDSLPSPEEQIPQVTNCPNPNTSNQKTSVSLESSLLIRKSITSKAIPGTSQPNLGDSDRVKQLDKVPVSKITQLSANDQLQKTSTVGVQSESDCGVNSYIGSKNRPTQGTPTKFVIGEGTLTFATKNMARKNLITKTTQVKMMEVNKKLTPKSSPCGKNRTSSSTSTNKNINDNINNTNNRNNNSSNKHTNIADIRKEFVSPNTAVQPQSLFKVPQRNRKPIILGRSNNDNLSVCGSVPSYHGHGTPTDSLSTVSPCTKTYFVHSTNKRLNTISFSNQKYGEMTCKFGDIKNYSATPAPSTGTSAPTANQPGAPTNTAIVPESNKTQTNKRTITIRQQPQQDGSCNLPGGKNVLPPEQAYNIHGPIPKYKVILQGGRLTYVPCGSNFPGYTSIATRPLYPSPHGQQQQHFPLHMPGVESQKAANSNSATKSEDPRIHTDPDEHLNQKLEYLSHINLKPKGTDKIPTETRKKPMFSHLYKVIPKNGSLQLTPRPYHIVKQKMVANMKAKQKKIVRKKPERVVSKVKVQWNPAKFLNLILKPQIVEEVKKGTLSRKLSLFDVLPEKSWMERSELLSFDHDFVLRVTERFFIGQSRDHVTELYLKVMQAWTCRKCKTFNDSDDMIECEACRQWFHLLCVGIRVAPKTWECQGCQFQKVFFGRKNPETKKMKFEILKRYSLATPWN